MKVYCWSLWGASGSLLWHRLRNKEFALFKSPLGGSVRLRAVDCIGSYHDISFSLMASVGSGVCISVHCALLEGVRGGGCLSYMTACMLAGV